MVFVDDLIQWGEPGKYRGKDAAQAERVGARHEHHWCHLFADTIEELHSFAQRLGFPHYDLAGGTWRGRAIELGAIEVPTRLAVRIIEGCKGIEKVKPKQAEKNTPWLE